MPRKTAQHITKERPAESPGSIDQMMLASRQAVFGEKAKLTQTEKELAEGISELPEAEQLRQYHIWVVNFLRSVSETVKKTEAEAAESIRLKVAYELMAMQDSMTGAYNKRYFEDRILKEMQKIDRSREAKKHRRTEQQEDGHLGLLFLDLDHFKKVNDTMGHDGGDLAIKEFSTIIQSLIREYDIFARIGGEEFAIILTDIQEKDALDKAEQIRRVVEDMLLSAMREKLTSKEQRDLLAVLDGTVSIGVATYSTSNKEIDPKALIKQADQALYHSKNSGRNQVTAFSPELISEKDREAVEHHAHA